MKLVYTGNELIHVLVKHVATFRDVKYKGYIYYNIHNEIINVSEPIHTCKMTYINLHFKNIQISVSTDICIFLTMSLYDCLFTSTTWFQYFYNLILYILMSITSEFYTPEDGHVVG